LKPPLLVLFFTYTFLIAENLNYKKINELNSEYVKSHLFSPMSSKCSDESDIAPLEFYLKSANELLNLPLALKIISNKVGYAMSNGEDKIVYDMINDFNIEYKNAKKYNLQEKIFYYKYLNLFLRVYTEGWAFLENDVDDITFKNNSNLSDDNILAMQIFLYQMEGDSVKKQDLKDYLLVYREHEKIYNSLNELDLNNILLKDYIKQNDVKNSLKTIDAIKNSNKVNNIVNKDYAVLFNFLYNYLNFQNDSSNLQLQSSFKKSLKNVKDNVSFFPFIFLLFNYIDAESIENQIYNLFSSSNDLKNSKVYFEYALKNIKDSKRSFPCIYNMLNHTWMSNFGHFTYPGDDRFLNWIIRPYMEDYGAILVNLDMFDELITHHNELMNSYEILEMHEQHLELLLAYVTYKKTVNNEKIVLDEIMPKILSLLNKVSPNRYYIVVGNYFTELIENTDLEDILNKKYLFTLSEIVRDGISYSADHNDYQYEYDLKLFLGQFYYENDIKHEIQYELYSDADSLQQLHGLKADYTYYWQYVLLLIDNEDYENAFSKLKILYGENILNEDYYNATINLDYILNNLLLNGHLVIEASKFLEKSISDMKNNNPNDRILAYLETLKFRYIYSKDNFQWIYDNFEKIDVDSIISISPFVINNSNDLGKNDWIENLIGLLLVVTNKKDHVKEQVLKKIIEDNAESLKSINNDVFFNNVLLSSLNFDLELFKKVSNRILSYENSYLRIKYKYDLGLWLYGKTEYDKGIYYLDEALKDIRDFEFPDLEAEILADLASFYYSKGNKELFKNIFEQYVPLAASLESYENIVVLHEQLFYSIIDLYSKEEQEELSKNYIEYAVLSENSLLIANAVSGLITYFGLNNYVDRAESVSQTGYELLKKGQIKNNHYLFISKAILDHLLIHEKHMNQFLDYNKSGIENYQDDLSLVIYDSIMMLKNIDENFKDIEELKNEYPFIYLNIILGHYETRFALDDIFTTNKQIEDLLSFLLFDVPNRFKQSAYMNCIWLIDSRLSDLETYPIENEYRGYGFNYNIKDEQIIVDNAIKNSPSDGKLKRGDIIVINHDIKLTEENVMEWFDKNVNNNSKLTEIFRSGKNLKIDLKPGSVQPNPFSKDPQKEIDQLLSMQKAISDSIVELNPSIFSRSDFNSYEKRFVMKYPLRKWVKDKKLLGKDLSIMLLNKYEKTSAFGFLNNAINHKTFLKNDNYLREDYKRKSSYLNEIQLELQKKDISEDKVSSLLSLRNELYNDINFFENYRTEKYGANSALNFDFSVSGDVFSDYDQIYRIVSDGYNNYGGFIIDQTYNYYSFRDFSYVEDNLNEALKLFNKTISYSALNENLYSDFYDRLINISKSINNNVIPTLGVNSVMDILVIPEDQFNLFPLEIMLVKQNKNSENFIFLSEIANISYAPSLSTHVGLKNINSNNKKSKKALLVSSNPNSDQIINYEDNLLAMRSEFGNIEFVDNEIQNIKNRMKKTRGRNKVRAKVLDSKNVTEEEFKNHDLSEYKYIHIAAHGVHDKKNPRFSGILLGRNEGDRDDGILQFHEIFPQDLNADLVTLSSCFSGYGEIDIDEGNLGIYRSFLLAGAKSVIISLWNVEDKSTALFFDKFYEKLFDGYGKAESLRLAKMYLKNETEYNHPFFWAPFILIGES
jgi:CHAT domain-containing protein